MVGWQLPGTRCEQGEMKKEGELGQIFPLGFPLDTVPLSYVLMWLLTCG